jgi:hypothetical protein
MGITKGIRILATCRRSGRKGTQEMRKGRGRGMQMQMHLLRVGGKRKS